MSLLVRLFTRPGCSLCDPVKFILKRNQQHFSYDYEEINISSPGQEQWHKLYDTEIPVVHINGQEVARHKLNERTFIQKLKQEMETTKQRENEKNK
jgi:hypothetical protein